MAVGGLEESVTVTSASPVVDMTSTTTSVNLTETLESTPIGRGLQQLFADTRCDDQPRGRRRQLDGRESRRFELWAVGHRQDPVDGIDIADNNSSGST
jgi:hypothetical protein